MLWITYQKNKKKKRVLCGDAAAGFADEPNDTVAQLENKTKKL
jgi:hypothetical protein